MSDLSTDEQDTLLELDFYKRVDEALVELNSHKRVDEDEALDLDFYKRVDEFQDRLYNIVEAFIEGRAENLAVATTAVQELGEMLALAPTFDEMEEDEYAETQACQD